MPFPSTRTINNDSEYRYNNLLLHEIVKSVLGAFIDIPSKFSVFKVSKRWEPFHIMLCSHVPVTITDRPLHFIDLNNFFGTLFGARTTKVYEEGTER